MHMLDGPALIIIRYPRQNKVIRLMWRGCSKFSTKVYKVLIRFLLEITGVFNALFCHGLFCCLLKQINVILENINPAALHTFYLTKYVNLFKFGDELVGTYIAFACCF
jgi:hypothetical protein